MKLWEQYIGNNYEKVDILKDSEDGIVALVYDKIGKQVSILKERDIRSKSIYETLRDMENPHIPHIYRLIEQKEKLIVLEEYVDGRTLADIIRYDERLDEKTAIHVLKGMCACLRPLHERNIIHRDIKPSNIILSRNEEVKLVDFGIARITRLSEEPDTAFLGTKGYAPPEQYGFGQTDARSDIYALGITMQRILGKGYHGSLTDVLRKCTAIDPENRYSSVDELLQDVELKQNKHRLYRWLLVIGTALILLASVLWLNSHRQKENSPAETKAEESVMMEKTAVPSAPVPTSNDSSSSDATNASNVQTSNSYDVALQAIEPQPKAVPVPSTNDNIAAAPQEGSVSIDAITSQWRYPALQRNQCSLSLNGTPCDSGIPIPAELWTQWEKEGDTVYFPSNWLMSLHIDNQSASDFVNPVLEVSYRGGERDQTMTRSYSTVSSGESADFDIPLSGRNISGKLLWLGIRLKDEGGASFYWEFQFYLE